MYAYIYAERGYIMKYMKLFKNHYCDRFKNFRISSLVEYEENLSKLIDSELFNDCILADEIIMLHELIRDECVFRLSKIAEDSM